MLAKEKKLVALFWPELRTLGGLWGLRLCWEDGEVWCVDNLSTDIGEKCEMGSISIEKLNLESDRISHEIIIQDGQDGYLTGGQEGCIMFSSARP